MDIEIYIEEDHLIIQLSEISKDGSIGAWVAAGHLPLTELKAALSKLSATEDAPLT